VENYNYDTMPQKKSKPGLKTAGLATDIGKANIAELIFLA